MDQETTRARHLQTSSVSRFPTDSARVSPPRFIGGEYSTKVDVETNSLLARFAAKNDTTPFVVLLTAFAVITHRITGDEDITFGTNSTGPEPFPIHVNVSSVSSFSSLLQTIREVRGPLSNDIKMLQIYFNFAADVADDVSNSSVFHLAFFNAAPKPPAVVQPPEISIGVSPDSPTRGSLELLVTYNQALFLQHRIYFMTEQLIQIVHGALSYASKPIGSIAMVTESQRRLLPDPRQDLHWNDFEGPIHEIFDKNALRRPDHPCVIENSYVNPEEQIYSYRKIYEASNIVAHYLQSRGITRGDVVMVYASRNVDLVVAIIGILKCGAIFSVIGNSGHSKANDRPNLSTNASDHLPGSWQPCRPDRHQRRWNPVRFGDSIHLRKATSQSPPRQLQHS
jgi:L-2-aminoadipate reductase